MKPASLNINPAVRFPGTELNQMTTRISQTVAAPTKEQDRLCTRVHGAGIEPNIMNRFMHSNSHEVLFVY